MRQWILILISSLFLIGCITTPIPPSKPETPDLPPTEVDIDLTLSKGGYIDLLPYKGDTAIIGGYYSGDRIIFTNSSEVYLKFVQCRITSTHAEDALVFSDDVRNMTLDGKGLEVFGGGITFWRSFNNVRLLHGKIKGTHTGIRATQDYASGLIIIDGWQITDASHEGIYIGPSKASNTKVAGVIIKNNLIYNCGWDGIQVGNTSYFNVFNNDVCESRAKTRRSQFC